MNERDKKCLENWNELEAKAKAYDVLKELLGNRMWVQGYTWKDEKEKKHIDYSLELCAHTRNETIFLTQEQYEILKKAGL